MQDAKSIGVITAFCNADQRSTSTLCAVPLRVLGLARVPTHSLESQKVLVYFLRGCLLVMWQSLTVMLHVGRQTGYIISLHVMLRDHAMPIYFLSAC